MNKLKHYVRSIFFILMQLPMPGTVRYLFAKYGGVNFIKTNHRNFIFIGKNVLFDTVYPEHIWIESGVHITSGCILLTHYLDTDNPDRRDIFWKTGKIHIKENAFIGINTIICSSVTIGKGAIIGAGSVVTKDVPDYQIWAGNPAHLIKERL